MNLFEEMFEEAFLQIYHNNTDDTINMIVIYHIHTINHNNTEDNKDFKNANVIAKSKTTF